MGIKVSNNGGANAVAVAEHAIGLMFAVNRKLDIQIDSAKNGTWMDGVEGDRDEFRGGRGRGWVGGVRDVRGGTRRGEGVGGGVGVDR